MAEIRLQRARVVARIGESVAAGMPQHVSVRFDPKLCSTPSTLDHPTEPWRAQWCATLADKYKG
jgi:hypothetical protein